MTWQFVDYQPPKLLSMRSTSGPMSEKREIKLETTATGETRVLHRYEGETKGFFKFADPLSAPIAKRQMRSAMERLKELLEKGPAT